MEKKSETKIVVPTQTKIVVPEERFGYNFKPIADRISQSSPQQQSQGQQSSGAQNSSQGNTAPQSNVASPPASSEKK